MKTLKSRNVPTYYNMVKDQVTFIYLTLTIKICALLILSYKRVWLI